jgi:hypothetical protein
MRDLTISSGKQKAPLFANAERAQKNALDQEAQGNIKVAR